LIKTKALFILGPIFYEKPHKQRQCWVVEKGRKRQRICSYFSCCKL